MQSDVAVDPGDRDGLVLGQPTAREQRCKPDDRLAGPGERESFVDQDLAAIGGSDRAIAAELDTVEAPLCRWLNLLISSLLAWI
jgi:hypothetical protein